MGALCKHQQTLNSLCSCEIAHCHLLFTDLKLGQCLSDCLMRLKSLIDTFDDFDLPSSMSQLLLLLPVHFFLWNEQINPPPVPKDLYLNFPLWDKEKWWLTKVQVKVSAPFLQRATKLTSSEASAGCTFLQVECAQEEGLDGLDHCWFTVLHGVY